MGELSWRRDCSMGQPWSLHLDHKFLVGPNARKMQKSKANKNTPRKLRGFSTMELIITSTILTIVTGLGLMGISRAKASVRLAGSAREYASYIEKARVYSIRRHANDAAERASIAINDDKASYNVTMDLDGDGGMDTRTVNLPTGITFETVETNAFDWRGRTWNTVGGDTTSNAQVSITLKYGSDSVSIDVTGSGDITVDSKVFDDSVPAVSLKVGDLTAGATPVPTPDTTSAATPDPGTIDPTDPVDPTDPTPTPTPTPTPHQHQHQRRRRRQSRRQLQSRPRRRNQHPRRRRLQKFAVSLRVHRR